MSTPVRDAKFLAYQAEVEAMSAPDRTDLESMSVERQDALQAMQAADEATNVGCDVDDHLWVLEQCRSALGALLRRLNESERVLARIEYVPLTTSDILDPDDDADDECPACGAFRSVGWHLPQCELAAVLNRPRGHP